jgi:hypothetical protein
VLAFCHQAHDMRSAQGGEPEAAVVVNRAMPALAAGDHRACARVSRHRISARDLSPPSPVTVLPCAPEASTGLREKNTVKGDATMPLRITFLLSLALLQACTSSVQGQMDNDLTKAIPIGNVEWAKEALATHDPNKSTGHGLAPMHLAAIHDTSKQRNMIQVLVSAGGDPNLRNASGLAPLHVARTAVAVEALVEAGADVNLTGPHQSTPLHMANNGEVASALLAQGADPNLENMAGHTPAQALQITYVELQRKVSQTEDAILAQSIQSSADARRSAFEAVSGEKVEPGPDAQPRLAGGDFDPNAGKDTGAATQSRNSLVLDHNKGEYLSPYTSDGVVAEWVDKAINAGIGSAAGSAVGAAVGEQVASQALDNVPFGGMLGGMLGSKVGKSAGREAAIKASGGWDYIRQTSDQSFRSLEQMAQYLVNEYGDEPTFSEVVGATKKVYPGLQDALAGVNQ